MSPGKNPMHNTTVNLHAGASNNLCQWTDMSVDQQYVRDKSDLTAAGHRAHADVHHNEHAKFFQPPDECSSSSSVWGEEHKGMCY